MSLTQKQIKQNHFDKIYENALEIECFCGCKTIIKNKDRYGRDKKYVNGHNRKKYEDPTQHKREWNHRNREKRYDYKKRYHIKRKLKLMELKGSICYNCNIKYNGENAAIFHFHHLDPQVKDFSVGNKLTSKSWETLLKETDKCNLLCANCHEMEHSRSF